MSPAISNLRWHQLRAILALPGVVTVLVPAILLYRERGAHPFGDVSPSIRGFIAPAGVVLIAIGLALMVQTIRLFTMVGEGTLAPWEPPRKFVAHGVYRHVRNPMMTGVFSILLGEAALFASPVLLAWFAIFAAVNATYIPLVEERGLERRFGDAYREYKRNVPRWIPRLTPWTPP